MEEMKTHVLESGQPGPRVLVLGAVHGNEPAGTRAIERFLRDGPALLRGSVTLVPVANPGAYAKGVRFIDVNLNRVFAEGAAASTYEARCAARLMPLMREADVLLDLHSTLAPAPPFAVIGAQDPATLALARAVGTAEVVVEGFAARRAYDLSFRYAARHGAAALLLECGQHEDPGAEGVAYAALCNVLTLHGMLSGEVKPLHPGPQEFLRVIEVVYNDEVASYAGRDDAPPPHRAPYAAGEVIAHLADGRELSYPYATCLLFANRGCADYPTGAEMFYVATQGAPGYTLGP